MQAILKIGADICAAIGLVFFLILLVGVVREGSELYLDVGVFAFLLIIIYLAILFLFFAPWIILFQSRHLPVSRWRYLLVGVAELLGVLLALAMLFPHF